ncbi:MAG: C13 family peptidase, partial [Gammaproteobacteria bacterium]|nr:C13 family peptidase [Gammaproteobacteria bacterium]
QERLYYNQYRLLNSALDSIHPSASGKSEIFFVGFGSDATQDVFMRETKHMQHAVNTHLDTSGRSMVMINNVRTMDTIPLATSTNLEFALKHIGQKMNPEEDVLFLYLTSHGSSNHELAVNMWLLDLNDIRPEDVQSYLDEAGIRWRIILISACYSGGFIQQLQNENSLIFTAAAADKTSFGCTNENDFTYFGEAVFDQIKREPYSLESSFKMVIEKIKQRELSEKLPHSEPQLFIGSMMLDKLKQLEQEIRFP